MESTTYRGIPEELWIQGNPPTNTSPTALVRWKNVSDESYEYSVMQWVLCNWLNYDGYAPSPTHPDTGRYIVLEP